MKHPLPKTSKKPTAILWFVLLCFCYIPKTDAQVCSGNSTNTLYGITSAGLIYPINATNAVVGSLVNTAAYTGAAASESNAMGYNPVNGLFYYFKVDPAAFVTQQFVSYNPTSNTYTTLSASPSSSTAIVSGCVSFNGTGYYCNDVNGILYYYNISTNKWTTISSKLVDQFNNNISTKVIQKEGSGDMAIDGLGNLWLLPSSSTNYSLYEIKAPLPTTVQASVSAKQIIAPTTPTPVSGYAFQGMAFNALGQLFLASGSGMLYELKNSTTLVSIAMLSNTNVNRDLTSCSFPFGVLPLTWASFSAKLNDNQVTLDWGVEDASQMQGFYVERSNDGINWNSLTYISYNEDQSNYSTIDYEPLPGANYYRIRGIGDAGYNIYTSIELINIVSASKIKVWPNPVTSSLNIQYNTTDNNTRAAIFDLLGKQVKNILLQPGDNSLDIADLPSGAYIIHILSSNGTVYNEKIYKQ